MQIKLANPRGFCAGVDRAIEIVERALELFGAPLYVKHEVVHNKFVVEDMIARGVIFVENIDEVPDGVPCIFSAHGVSLEVRSQAKEKNLKVFDATCPLVTKVHFEVKKYSNEGCECILIGHEGHPEVEGTIGQFNASNGGTCTWLRMCKMLSILRSPKLRELPMLLKQPYRWMTLRQ